MVGCYVKVISKKSRFGLLKTEHFKDAKFTVKEGHLYIYSQYVSGAEHSDNKHHLLRIIPPKLWKDVTYVYYPFAN